MWCSFLGEMSAFQYESARGRTPLLEEGIAGEK
jgi:hypothetical protein